MMFLDLYPVMNRTNSGDILQLFHYVNTLTDGLFFPVMLLVVWTIQFIGMISQGQGASKAWIYAGFTSSVLAIMLGILAFVSQKWVYLIIISVSLGAFWFKVVNTSTS